MNLKPQQIDRPSCSQPVPYVVFLPPFPPTVPSKREEMAYIGAAKRSYQTQKTRLTSLTFYLASRASSILEAPARPDPPPRRYLGAALAAAAAVVVHLFQSSSEGDS